jgi:hypothetical protein
MDVVIALVWMLELVLGRWRPDLNLVELRLFLLLVVLDLLLLDLLFDGLLGLLELSHVLHFATGQLASVIEFELFDAYLRLEYFCRQ